MRPSHDVFGSYLTAWFFDDDGFDGFAAVGVVGGDDAALLDCWVLVHHGFDFGWPDFEAAGVDHSFEAVGEEEEAFGIHVAEVAGAEEFLAVEFGE